MVGSGELLAFYNQKQAVEAINFNTLGLLVGMMIIVGIVQQTGFFECLSIRVAKRTGNNQFTLFLALCGLTAFASAILDNVTTIVLVAPMTLAVTEALGVPHDLTSSGKQSALLSAVWLVWLAIPQISSLVPPRNYPLTPLSFIWDRYRWLPSQRPRLVSG